MTKVLVLYHSTYGHIEQMAGAIAEGARGVDGVEVTVKVVGLPAVPGVKSVVSWK